MIEEYREDFVTNAISALSTLAKKKREINVLYVKYYIKYAFSNLTL